MDCAPLTLYSPVLHWNFVYGVFLLMISLPRRQKPHIDYALYAIVGAFIIAPIFEGDFKAYLPTDWAYHMWDERAPNEAMYLPCPEQVTEADYDEGAWLVEGHAKCLLADA